MAVTSKAWRRLSNVTTPPADPAKNIHLFEGEASMQKAFGKSMSAVVPS